MQTFLPVPDFVRSAEILDRQRLCKQRVEALQILRIVSGITPDSRWRNHPAVKMWLGYEQAVTHYMNCCIFEWIRRGYNNTMLLYPSDEQFAYPKWFGNDAFHKSHRSNLLRKNREFYSQYGWKEPNDLPYFWPDACST